MSLLNEFSIQLYSMRDETKKDFIGVLDKLGEIGYTGVEFAGYGDISATEMKMALDKNNLRSIGSHVRVQRLEENLDEELEYNKILGTQYIIVPISPVKTRDDVLELAMFLNRIGKKCLDAGFLFGYHNHSHEFVKDGGEYLLDILFKNVDPDIVKMELDLYWTAYAGVDPISYMAENIERLRLLHIKQILDYESRKCVDLDEGIIDFAGIITKAKAYGVEHFILEQEEFAVSPFVSVEKGYKHIMSL